MHKKKLIHRKDGTADGAHVTEQPTGKALNKKHKPIEPVI
jgi:hypothetical protein